MSHWNYRIIRHQDPTQDYYEIHEVYYDDKGKPMGWTENPCAPFGETPEELISCIEMMLTAAKKSMHDVIDYDSKPEGEDPTEAAEYKAAFSEMAKDTEALREIREMDGTVGDGLEQE